MNIIKYTVENGQQIADRINQSRGVGQYDRRAVVSGGCLQIPTLAGGAIYAKPGDAIEIDGLTVSAYRQIAA